METLIAETKQGHTITITCEEKDGKIKSTYPIEKSFDPSIKKEVVVAVLSPQQVFDELKIEVPKKITEVKIALQNDSVRIYEKLKEKMEKEEQRIRENKKKLAKTVQPILFTYIIGCDTSDTIQFSFPKLSEFENDSIINYRNDKDLLEACVELIRTDDNNTKYPGKKQEARLYSYGGYEVEGESLISLLKDAQKKVQEMQKEREEQARRKKEREEQKTKAKKEKLQNAYDNELMIFGTELLSSTNYLLIHSLAIKFDAEKIEIYDTRYKRYMNTKGTYGIKDILKKNGFVWNNDKGNWNIEYSDTNLELATNILKEHDVKGLPFDYDLVQCWECGTYYKMSEMSEDVGGYYCGC